MLDLDLADDDSNLTGAYCHTVKWILLLPSLLNLFLCLSSLCSMSLYADLPTEKDIEKMQKDLFGAFDDPNEGLDQAFAKIQNLRELGANLPDSERRKLAAQVALSFAAHFNENEDEPI